MKKFAVLISFAFATICSAAPAVGTVSDTQQQSMSQQQLSLPSSCNSYETCLDLGLKERTIGAGSVLLHYSGGSKDVRYNLFDNISVKFNSNVCPPLLDVYKKVNNVNYLMDVFIRKDESSCISYFANITGDGKDRDVVVGQLEIRFCNQDELFESCENGIVYGKINKFSREKEDRSKDNTQQNSQSVLPAYDQQSQGLNSINRQQY